jgi:hypothetical protein
MLLESLIDLYEMVQFAIDDEKYFVDHIDIDFY